MNGCVERKKGLLCGGSWTYVPMEQTKEAAYAWVFCPFMGL